MTLDNVAIQNNRASQGGGIYNEYGNLVINNSYIEGNQASEGGGVYNLQGSITINDSQVSYNQAQEGGAFYDSQGDSTVNDSIVQNNQATFGGAAYTIDATSHFNNSAIENNLAQDGGAFWVSSGHIDINNSTLTANNATLAGHLFLTDASSATWNDTLGQYAQGGAVWIEQASSLSCTKESALYSGFWSNHLSTGGAINIFNSGSFTGISCDLGEQNQPQDNSDSDIVLFDSTGPFLYQEANNNAYLTCSELECNYQTPQ